VKGRGEGGCTLDTSSTFSLQNIISIIALSFGGVLAAIIKVMWGRVFRSIDDQIKAVQLGDIKKLSEEVKDHESRIRSLENCNSSLEEYKKRVDGNVAVVKADIAREVEIVTGHLNSIHQKINHLDEKLDRVASLRR
jgi:Mg2+ and Co2+ transporter CorA